ncbi:accessory factor UbiK family protein [Gallaecimonas kandeliae]|uniref:ubiquinone biosynthesis accessory factor UbiK n=1 Tax=Gallaecimonas kandeliae TaxID=3029055 RepID=UPI00264A044F|nr:accessory factor UbiK family protein [Gallaecimonas kandeliae]WKE65609.1 accessory factor UbiK family protein [Gallaecimonas kandeliae]
MINANKLEELAKQITEALPPGVKAFGNEVESRVKQVLQAQLMKLDLVSRDEFEVQSRVLLKTREKLDALEARVEALEKGGEAES